MDFLSTLKWTKGVNGLTTAARLGRALNCKGYYRLALMRSASQLPMPSCIESVVFKQR